MTAAEYRTLHGDPAGWTTAQHETYEHLAHADQLPVPCWFCGADNAPTYSRCGFCNHHADDGPTPAQATAADRLRALLAHAA
ncbi:hypothetical protein [Streptomyces zhihengii]